MLLKISNQMFKIYLGSSYKVTLTGGGKRRRWKYKNMNISRTYFIVLRAVTPIDSSFGLKSYVTVNANDIFCNSLVKKSLTLK